MARCGPPPLAFIRSGELICIKPVVIARRVDVGDAAASKAEALL
jgi:hypothetical protein